MDFKFSDDEEVRNVQKGIISGAKRHPGFPMAGMKHPLINQAIGPLLIAGVLQRTDCGDYFVIHEDYKDDESISTD